MAPYSTYLADAHKPAIEQADKTSLSMTVFYHPDWAFSCADTGSKILHDKKTTMHVTWLPNNFFVAT